MKEKKEIAANGLTENVEEVKEKICTPKEELFCQRYIANYFNGAKSAREAGYSESVARETAHDLLTKAHIQKRINELRAELIATFDLTKERLAQILMRIAEFDPRKLYDDIGLLKEVADLDDDTAGAVASVEVFKEFEGQGANRKQVGSTTKVKASDRIKAAEALARLMGLNAPDKTEVSGGIILSQITGMTIT